MLSIYKTQKSMVDEVKSRTLIKEARGAYELLVTSWVKRSESENTKYCKYVCFYRFCGIPFRLRRLLCQHSEIFPCKTDSTEIFYRSNWEKQCATRTRSSIFLTVVIMRLRWIVKSWWDSLRDFIITDPFRTSRPIFAIDDHYPFFESLFNNNNLNEPLPRAAILKWSQPESTRELQNHLAKNTGAISFWISSLLWKATSDP